MLPHITNPKNRISVLAVTTAVFGITYMVPNHLHYFKPMLLPLSSIDRAVPFLPWTIFIYLSEYFFLIATYFWLEHEENRNKYIWGFLGINVLSSFIFFLFPTTYPRELYPLVSDPNSLTYQLFSNFRVVDDASNSFPSMHVACCYFTAFAYRPKGEARWKYFAALTWASAIALSTLTTKQHYLIDILAGFGVACLGYALFFVKFRYVSMEEFSRRIRSLFRRIRSNT